MTICEHCNQFDITEEERDSQVSGNTCTVCGTWYIRTEPDPDDEPIDFSLDHMSGPTDETS